MLRALLACVRSFVAGMQPHDAHQPPDAVTPTFMTIALHVASHLARPVPRGFQELLIDDCHEPQVLRTLTTLRFIIHIGTRQCQQRALAANAQLMILTHHFLPRGPSNWGRLAHDPAAQTPRTCYPTSPASTC